MAREQPHLLAHFADGIADEQQRGEMVNAGPLVCRDFVAHLIGRSDEIDLKIGVQVDASGHGVLQGFPEQVERGVEESFAGELWPWGIHVILIEPASIRTDAVGKVEADAERVLQQMTDTDRQLYATTYRSMTRNALARERNGSHPDVVARTVLRALTARRPRNRRVLRRN
ncbi:hypothetical protein [Mycobacterium xenopi]|uniref:Dehydrogenase/decarboxylase domain protein n=1 Tax=Mycobacterium xenopi 4042 TaxID=1299334 RepID=X8AGG0_MYCXE|nr:hypothetical protein [Mycobacterium xenopi]EUA30103.1 dehydrogenase/decarboxylase domain protein [Mycobacterium xenopi 4042]MDA3640612.1 hypothetical protein [Mycobacterium xenopi]MDA3657313.1 hypothetical protein [Mycobacterium xenopi]